MQKIILTGSLVVTLSFSSVYAKSFPESEEAFFLAEREQDDFEEMLALHLEGEDAAEREALMLVVNEIWDDFNGLQKEGKVLVTRENREEGALLRRIEKGWEELKAEYKEEVIDEAEYEKKEHILDKISANWADIRKAFEPALEEVALVEPVSLEMGQESSREGMVALNEGKEKSYIDPFKVTNLQYREFILATGGKAPSHWCKGEIAEGAENDPVVNVDLASAKAYAKWVGKRLPKEEEFYQAERDHLLPDITDYINEWTVTEVSESHGTRSLVRSKGVRKMEPQENSTCNAFTGFRCAADK